MAHTQDERHPFLDDLTTDAELVSSVLRGPVTGRDEIRLAVNAVGRSTPRRRSHFFRLSVRGSFSSTRPF